MGHFTASFFDQLLDILHHFVRLRDGIVAIQINRVIQVLWALTAQPDRFASLRNNSLTKVIVEVLLRVGIRCVEGSDADMGHGGSLFGRGALVAGAARITRKGYVNSACAKAWSPSFLIRGFLRVHRNAFRRQFSFSLTTAE